MNDQTKILIVEDEMITALDLKKFLEKEINADTKIATNAVDAIINVEKDKPQLIIMDIMLKGKLSGIDAADIIRKRFNIPLIYITSFKDDETFLNAHLTNPIDIIGKPFKQSELLEKIKYAISDESISQKHIHI